MKPLTAQQIAEILGTQVAAGNSGATDAYWSFVVPAAAIAFLTYLAASIALFIRGYWQLAQYLAWAPLLLIVSLQTVQLGSLLLT